MADLQRERILHDTHLLRGLCKYLLEEVGDHRVRFVKNMLAPELFSFQARNLHLVDIGKLFMQLSFLVRGDYSMLGRINTMACRPSDTPLQAAYRDVFFDIRFHRWLLFFLDQHFKGDSRWQPIRLLPGILAEVAPTLAEYDNVPPEEAFSCLG